MSLYGDYSFGGDIWILDGGEHAITRFGVASRLRLNQSNDLNYGGTLDYNGYEGSFWRGFYFLTSHAAANRTGASEIVDYDFFDQIYEIGTRLVVFEQSNLERIGQIFLPKVKEGGICYTLSGDHVFISDDGEHLFVFGKAVKDDDTSVIKWALIELDLP